jgi:hypothetical protein
MRRTSGKPDTALTRRKGLRSRGELIASDSHGISAPTGKGSLRGLVETFPAGNRAGSQDFVGGMRLSRQCTPYVDGGSAAAGGTLVMGSSGGLLDMARKDCRDLFENPTVGIAPF